MILDTLRLAFVEIRRNLLRSLLTALGILLGVGAVIAMVSLGQGATASVEQDLAGMGSNMLILTPGAQGGPGSRSPAPDFQLRDVQAIRGVDHVLAVAPAVSAPARVVRAQRQLDTTVQGSTGAWLEIQGWTLAEGRKPRDAEILAGAAVCLLGATVQETLFGRQAAVGGRVLVGNASCTVIGLLAAKGSNTMGMDQDDLVFMPLAAVQRRLVGTTGVSTIYVSVDDPAHIDRVSTELDTLMRGQRHIAPTAEPDYSIHDTRQMASMVTGITGTLTAFLGAVAGVSLLVGGIGIMNIMLVSVTERTREIGIRMAIGAQERDVLTQFLVEAALLSTLGGVLGVGVGLLGSFAGSRVLGLPFVVEPLVVVIAVAFSGLVGLTFGWFPARRAARMEPVDALRHD